MENQKRNTGLYVVIAILCMFVLTLGGYIVFDKIQNNKASETSTTNDTNNTTNQNSNSLVSKLDNSKDWIYDAEYKKNVGADSYSTYYKTYYAKDIVVPFINIDSSYATTSNSEIKKVFDDAIKSYNDGVSDKISYVNECNYKKYVNNNNIYVILTYGIGSTDVVHPKYYTYNINLKSGNKLSYEDVYNVAGLNSSNIESKVESAITKAMKEKMVNFSSDNYSTGTNFDTYNNESINNYKNSVSNNSLKYFLADNGKLNIIVKLSIPAGTGEFDTIITID